MAFRFKQEVEHLVKDCDIDLGVCINRVSLYSTTLGSYDVVISVDWLENHDLVLDCKAKKIYFTDDSWHKRVPEEMNMGVSLRFMSAL